MALKDHLHSGIAALAVAAVAPCSFAAGDASPAQVHPLLSGVAFVKHVGGVSEAMAKASGDESARVTARGFVGELHKVLKETREKPRTVVYPKDAVVGQLSVVAVVPPTGMETVPIGVCLQQGVKAVVNGKDDVVHTNIGTLEVLPDGTVVPQVWNGVKTGGEVDGKFQAACAPYRAARIQWINEAAAAQAPRR